MPPTMSELFNIHSQALPIIGLYYNATTARWTDGLSDYQCDFHDAWHPFFNHPAITNEIKAAGLRQSAFGGDEEDATHMLLINRVNSSMSISTFLDGLKLIQLQPHPLHSPMENAIDTVKKMTIDDLETLSIHWFKNASTGQPSRDEINVLQQKMIEHLNQFSSYQNIHLKSHESRRI